MHLMSYLQRALAFCTILAMMVSMPATAATNALVVVVYPLTLTGAGDPGAGEQIASLLAQRLDEPGSVEIRQPAPGVLRQDYLETARKLGADYYLSGFVTKISGQLSVVEQLVSTLSNTTVWSNDARLVTTDDARAQGDLVRTAVIEHAGRAVAAAKLPPVTSPAPSIAPPGSVTPAATATAPAPHDAAVKPSFAILETAGDASPGERSYADAEIAKVLRMRGFEAVLLNDPVGDLSILGPALCASSGLKLLLGGTIEVKTMPDREINQWATAKIDLNGYDCIKGRALAENSGSGATYNWNWALDQAITDAMKKIAVE
jgi:hypothetical protein